MIDFLFTSITLLNVLVIIEYIILLLVSIKSDVVSVVFNSTNLLLMFVPFVNMVIVLSIAFSLLKAEQQKVNCF